MNIAQQTAKRLRQQLAAERELWEAEQAAKLAAVEAEAARAQANAISVASARAEDAQRSANAVLQAGIESEMRKGDHGLTDGVTDLATRQRMASYFGADLSAVRSAASCECDPFLFADDVLAPAVGNDGKVHTAPAELLMALAALTRLYNRATGYEASALAQAEAAERAAQREEYLNQRVNEWAAQRAVQAKMEEG